MKAIDIDIQARKVVVDHGGFVQTLIRRNVYVFLFGFRWKAMSFLTTETHFKDDSIRSVW